MTDGANNRRKLDHLDFWNLIEKKRLRLYAIGMGAAQYTYIPEAGSYGGRVLGHIALAMNGRSLF